MAFRSRSLDAPAHERPGVNKMHFAQPAGAAELAAPGAAGWGLKHQPLTNVGNPINHKPPCLEGVFTTHVFLVISGMLYDWVCYSIHWTFSNKIDWVDPTHHGDWTWKLPMGFSLYQQWNLIKEGYFLGGCFFVFFVFLFSRLALWLLWPLWLLWVCGFCGFTMLCLSNYLSNLI